MTSEAETIIGQFQAGNERYRKGCIENHNFPEEFSHLQEVKAQPKAMVLTCMDSRIAPELIFDVHLGEIFDARVAGNIVNPDIIASMKLACLVANTRLIIVMGHTDCKAISSAIDEIQLGSFTGLLTQIQPSIAASRDHHPELEATSSNPNFVNVVARDNITRNIQRIRDFSPLLRQREEAGELSLVPCLYHVETGEAEFF
ncbi:MAG: carbonic anhydrase [Verrucomicrobiota bacterium]